MDRKSSLAHGWLGFALAEAERYEEAITELHVAIALSEREDEQLFGELGWCCYKAARYAEAVEAYQEAIRVARNPDAEYHLRLGEALHANGQEREACAEWEKVFWLPSWSEEDAWDQARAKIQANCEGKGYRWEGRRDDAFGR